MTEEIRRVQSIGDSNSLSFVIPKKFTVELGIKKGDYIIFTLEGDKLILRKMVP